MPEKADSELDIVTQRYKDGAYLSHNPSWDLEDSPWKASHVLDILGAGGLKPHRIAEVGCGAGGVLVEIGKVLPQAALYGFDISPDARPFWERHDHAGITFKVGDFLREETGRFDLILLLDVLEHLADPFRFLNTIRERADYFVFHFPLDLSALSVLRESPLLNVREKVGHIHFFTRGLAFALLRECGFEIVQWNFTGAGLHAPQRTLRTHLAGLPRKLLGLVSKDLSARLLGGETLMVLARPQAFK